MKVYQILQEKLSKIQHYLTDDGKLNILLLIQKAQEYDSELIELLLDDKETKKNFFLEIKGALVFNQFDFIYCLEGQQSRMLDGKELHETENTKLNDTLQDFNSRKVMENENVFQVFFTNSHSVILIIDFVTGDIVDANNAACNFYGYAYEEIIALNVNKLTTLAPQVVRKVMTRVKDVQQNHFYFKHKLKSGELRDVEVYSGKILIHNKNLLYSIIHDVTQTKIAERALLVAKERAEESEKQFSELFEHLEQGFALNEMIYDEKNKPIDYRFVLVNQAFGKLTGMGDISEIIGRNVTEVFPETEQIWIDNFGKVAQTGKSLQFLNYSQTFGKYYDVVAYSPKKDFFAVIFTDITQIKLAEQELIVAKEKAEEGDRLKTAFLQNMSHEIRTPMNAIIGFSEMLNYPEISEEKRKNFRAIIQTNAYQLLAIVNNILTISSIETEQEKLNITKCSINKLINDLYAVFETQIKTQSIKLLSHTALTNQESEIETDKTKLTQILTNLIANALKFTREGKIEFGYSLKKNELLFYVKDNGIGIKPEYHEEIFMRFRQADSSIHSQYGGNGLGLAISKSFVELLGGKIWVESEYQKGATFYFTIPYKPIK